LNSNNIEANFKRALAFHQHGELIKASALYESILNQDQNHLPSIKLLGTLKAQLGLYKHSIQLLNKALNLKPDDPYTLNNIGNAYQALGKFESATESFINAIKIKANYAEAYNNLGYVKEKLGLISEANNLYEKAIQLNENYAEAYNNKANILNLTGDFDEALNYYNKAININSNYLDAYSNKAHLLNNLGRHNESIDAFRNIYNLNPNYDFLLGAFYFARMQMCDWENYNAQTSEIIKKINENKKVADPFSMFSVSDSLNLQKKIAKIYTRSKIIKPQKSVKQVPNQTKKNKIRIGYYSSDFRNHPVGNLLLEFFELHNEKDFEIIAFSFGPKSSDSIKLKLATYFDKFIEVNDKSDKEIADLGKAFSLDLAVDLNGYTAHHRANIFSYRVAPIQISYIGYPGTMNNKHIDYLIADKVIIPPEKQKYYSEKIIYLPNTYQVTNRKKIISSKKITKKDLGLPRNQFIYCCFNSSYKINPKIFDVWMRILKKVDNSILWLVKNNDASEKNLKKEALLRGVNPERIIFVNRKSYDEYLAQQMHADLFLDTFPYNGHSTTSDSLLIGLPVLTLKGNTFASRVGASLLSAANMPELISTNLKDYEIKAVNLALDYNSLKSTKKKLASNINNCPLFDVPTAIKNIEMAYRKALDSYKKNHPIDHIEI
jgi:predicted O-linked N-acetylglucosamine transferase (SPINDLY family)